MGSMTLDPLSLDFVLTLLDRVGVLVFAISGGIVAVRAKMDWLGILVLSFLPALGGGTLRDLILDAPVFWLTDGWSLLMVLIGAILSYLFANSVEDFKPLRWADAVGLSLFAVAGAAKAIDLGHGITIAVIMGGVTASAGGLLRDIVANREPLLLKQDIYATAALLGGLGYGLAQQSGLSFEISTLIGSSLAFAIRACAIHFGWSLPRAK
ncbi:trimeric intracellular cation channel family protein [Algimonas porphyrae]|uniref:Membrane protein n=1 Tax=Algimonas porphyrae TaxID=1128113 RepID=A0ABQ5UWR2_9PROT|nr:trimeric intracellular cation channel family protein [Algimonas porphyrae]GLQ19636.1 membrane protein [Algimonas porphyrae]